MKKKNLILSAVLCALLSLSMGGLGWAQNIGINTTGSTPNASAMLDVDATDKGILVPRVALTSTSSASPVTSPATSLIVYNTASVNDVIPGFYYWNGSAWTFLQQRTPSMQVFTVSGTWTKPAGVTKIKVTVVGGGGGGGSYFNGNYGGGGGGGGTAIKYIDVTSVNSVAVTVGTAGSGSSGGAGGTGGTSSFGVYCSATGGSGGGQGGGCGAGGIGSGGDLNLGGGAGWCAGIANPAAQGGNSYLGGGGVPGGSGREYGGGGGSGWPEGYPGFAGVVIVEEY